MRFFLSSKPFSVFTALLMLCVLPPFAQGQSGKSTRLTLAVAASLTESIQEIEATYHHDHPEVEFTNTFGSSGLLARQIEQGAPVDLFLSAAEKPIKELDGQGLLVPKSAVTLLRNQLVLIAPASSKLSSLNQLTAKEIRAVALGEPQSVPAGQYAEESLTKLNLMNAIRPHVVYGKDVRQVLSFVATGNADAGLVYATDAMTTQNVRVVLTIPESSHEPIVYPAALIARRPYTAQAQAFLGYLSTPAARAIWQKHGFSIASR